MFKTTKIFVLLLLALGIVPTLYASQLVEMKVMDKDYLMLHFEDGIVAFVDDGKGSTAYTNNIEVGYSKAISYGAKLNLAKAVDVNNWLIKSIDDANYGASGIAPAACFRQSKVNGMSQGPWGSSDWIFDYTYEHFIYLQLPRSLQENKTYTVAIDPGLNVDTTSQTISFDIFNCPSEAIHVNLVGYMASSRIKAADLYHFLGDGGNRNYSSFVGNKVYIYDVNTKASEIVGSVIFWMVNKKETQWNLTGSDVWNIDFTGFNRPGTYRLAVEGVGCSQDFEIRDDIYHDPFKVCLTGYFYMRIGQDNLDLTPVPRRPLYIQDQDPANCKIYVTDMHPYHPYWESFASGDKWDRPANWIPYKKAGEPTNPRAKGGHSDALDWDRHLGHVVDIYDVCLAYILSDGALDDDDLRIAESGNGIPDLLDEARNEVDFWLNLRYNGGYSHGLTNPDGNNKLYQADNTAIAAWANALNSAMLAYCFQIAGLSELRNTYLDSAVIAYNYANHLADPMLDLKCEEVRGRDFKMMAAAYLYNLTGERAYEDAIKSECMVTSPNSEVYQQGAYNQIWGIAAYLLTKRQVHYPELQANMKSAMISKAKIKEADYVQQRPSRRGYSNEQAWWQTNQDMHRTIIAHAITDNPTDQLTFLDALLLEADWGLGRNPLNMIQMTTATTELADKRSVENCYTSGRDDGTPGLHPGHTPYLNTEGWGGVMVGSNPGKVLEKFYPNINNWPHASKYISTRFIWAHSEFTPRQTMRGKTLLYAYLYSLSKSGGNITPLLVADAGPDQKMIDEDGDGKEMVQLNGSRSYSSNNQIVSYIWRQHNREIATGKTATVELDTGRYEITLEVKDASGESASDTVTIEIIPKISGEKPDYDFETPDQLNHWSATNWGQGGVPTATITTEKAHGGSHSLKFSGNYVANSQNVLKKAGALAADIGTIVYHVWISRDMVDSSAAAAARDASKAGGIQNYLMYTGWQWRDKWYSIGALQGDAWNILSFQIPDDVKNSDIIEIGMVATMQNANAGVTSLYIDDIFFVKKSPSAIQEPGIELADIPQEFKLLNNYPNPFNPETTIGYHLPKNSRVKMNVYDITGRRVRTLIDGDQSAGRHEVTFAGSDLASGVYLYMLEAGGYKEVKKMVLLK